MLEVTRRSLTFKRRPLFSLWRLALSEVLPRTLQRVTLLDEVVLHSPHGHPTRCYAWTGELSLGVAAATASLLGRGSTFIDIGAFVGQHTMRAAAIVGHEGSVVAVEPDPRALHWLRMNVGTTDHLQIVTILEAAVDIARETTTLHLGPLSMSRVNGEGAGLIVNAISIDDLIERFKPHLIKVDVEGLEARIIATSARLNDPTSPTLIVEDNPGVREALKDQGYQIVDLMQVAGTTYDGCANFSADVLAFKEPFRLDDFSRRYRSQLERLSVPPKVTLFRSQ